MKNELPDYLQCQFDAWDSANAIYSFFDARCPLTIETETVPEQTTNPAKSIQLRVKLSGGRKSFRMICFKWSSPKLVYFGFVPFLLFTLFVPFLCFTLIL